MAMRNAAIALALGLAGVAAGPAAAQSANELSWAATNCLTHIQKLGGARRAFEARGYAYELEDYGIGPEGRIYWHTSPDRAVTVGVNIQPSRGSCTITSKGVTVGRAAPFAKQAAEAVLGTAFRDGSPPGQSFLGHEHTLCRGAWAKVRGGVVHVNAIGEGQDPVCAAKKPAQIIVSFTKG